MGQLLGFGDREHPCNFPGTEPLPCEPNTLSNTERQCGKVVKNVPEKEQGVRQLDMAVCQPNGFESDQRACGENIGTGG